MNYPQDTCDRCGHSPSEVQRRLNKRRKSEARELWSLFDKLNAAALDADNGKTKAYAMGVGLSAVSLRETLQRLGMERPA